MFADVFDQDKFDEPIILNYIYGSIAAAQSDRPVTFPGTVQGLIVIARKPSNSLKTIKLNSTNPGHKVLDNMARTFAQIFLGARGKRDRLDHDVRIARRGNVSTVKVAHGMVEAYTATSTSSKPVVKIHGHQSPKNLSHATTLITPPATTRWWYPRAWSSDHSSASA